MIYIYSSHFPLPKCQQSVHTMRNQNNSTCIKSCTDLDTDLGWSYLSSFLSHISTSIFPSFSSNFLLIDNSTSSENSTGSAASLCLGGGVTRRREDLKRHIQFFFPFSTATLLMPC